MAKRQIPLSAPSRRLGMGPTISERKKSRTRYEKNLVVIPSGDSSSASSSSSRVFASRSKVKCVGWTEKMKTCEDPVEDPVVDPVEDPIMTGEGEGDGIGIGEDLVVDPVEDPIMTGEGEGDGIGIGEPESLESWSCCEICAESRHDFEMVEISERCSHSFCASCVVNHVETKIRENIADIKCLGLNCGSVIEVGICRGFIDGKLLERWENSRCEAVFDKSQKYYCPFNECSAMFIIEGESGDSLKECECPYCHRLFCGSCRVSWHSKCTCEEFQSMDEDERENDDVLMKELAFKNNWGRCPSCRIYVEKIFG